MELIGKKLKMIHKEKVIDGNEIDAVRIIADSADVHIATGSGTEVQVLLEGKISESVADGLEFEVTQSGSVVNIIVKERKRMYFGVMKRNLNLYVTVPSMVYDDFYVKSSSGDSIINNIDTKSYTGIISSGNHVVTNLYVAENMVLKATSGDVVAKNSQANSVMGWVTSGKVNVRDLSCKRAKYEATSGKIELHTDKLEGNTECNVTSGNIHIHSEAFSGELDCRATSGNVQIYSKEFPENLRVDCRVTSGNRKVRIGGLKVTEEQKNSFSGVKGESGINSVQAVTTSGNIMIKD